ncbi:hypothetical protein JCM14467A_00300 [Vulcanisaeta sp. JCM 14467]
MAIETVKPETLGLAVKGKEVMSLRRFINTFRIPQWHPCPCSEGKTAEELGRAYLDRLLETSQRVLLPILTIGNYVLTSTCLLMTAVKYASNEILDKVRVEVWNLGEYRDEERFAVMALAAELCRVHEDKGDRDIKLEFARELIRRYVIDTAMKDPGQALKLINELSQGFHTTELAKVLSKYIKVTPRAGENYVRVFTRDKSFINELRGMVMELDKGVEKSTALSDIEQNISVDDGEKCTIVFAVLTGDLR